MTTRRAFLAALAAVPLLACEPAPKYIQPVAFESGIKCGTHAEGFIGCWDASGKLVAMSEAFPARTARVVQKRIIREPRYVLTTDDGAEVEVSQAEFDAARIGSKRYP